MSVDVMHNEHERLHMPLIQKIIFLKEIEDK